MSRPKGTVPQGEFREDIMRNMALRLLIKNDMAWSKTQRQTGVPKTTLRRWWDALSDEDKEDLKTVVSDDVTAMWRAVEDAALSEIIKRVPGMKDHDLTITAGIAADKAMKYAGISDETAHTVRIEPSDIANEIESMLRGVRSRAGQAARQGPV